MKYLFFILIFFSLSFDTIHNAGDLNFRRSAEYRWLNKEVLESRMLDNMNNLDHWKEFTTGAQQIVDARVDFKQTEASRELASISITNDKKHNGDHSLKMRIPARLNIPGPKSGRGWGTAGVHRVFDGEDWQDWNRISLWIYPDNPGTYVNWLELRIYNDGVEKLPAQFGQEGETSLILRDHEWNHVVWEIGNVARDKITALEVSYYLSGNEPEATDTATFYLDQLELQKVKPDYIEGWKVWPGRISYSQDGYEPGAVKTAIANNLEAKNFSLINQETGETVLEKPILNSDHHLGSFQVMDFSEIREAGTFIIKAGSTETHPFRIGSDIWRESIFKAINFFYEERCGFPIPGRHDVCHRDWTCTHDGKTIVVNGGWHDAGDLTQGITNTGETVYAMFDLAQKLKSMNQDRELYKRLMEEATWGLKWILKTSFHDGYRFSGAANSRKTDGIIGNNDDISVEARYVPVNNFIASAAEGIASRTLKETDPRLSAYALRMAEEDWHFAEARMKSELTDISDQFFRGTFDSNNVLHEIASQGIIASIEIWKATGNDDYINKAVEWARVILESHQRIKPEWKIPITGFFYTGPDKKNILHYCHRGHEQEPIQALTELCRALPDHPDWMKWYSAVVLHSEYLKTITRYSEPYNVIAASIYSDQEYKMAPESRRESYRQQVLEGIPLGDGHYLRLFPVWMDYRGHFGTILPKALALEDAASLRNDPQSSQLAQQQLEWVIGRNPFAQSCMMGEGYDYTPLYSPMSGYMAGSLPVGIQTKGAEDVPYWPAQSTWTYKEVWVHPVAQWIWLMKGLYLPSIVEGKAKGEVIFTEDKTGHEIRIQPDISTGEFHAKLPQGKYRITCGDQIVSRTLLPSEKYFLDMTDVQKAEFSLSANPASRGEIIITLTVKGTGNHSFDLRTDNLDLSGNRKEITLKSGQNGTVTWKCKIHELKAPWVAVVIPDSKMELRKEISGNF